MKNTAAAKISPEARGGRAGNAEKLGIRIEPFMPPSRRHPEGAIRCRGVTQRDGLPRQCRRKARDGFPVCSHHGAGSRKRELAGIAKNPALARLKSGKRAKPSTFEQLCWEKPELQFFSEKNRNGNAALDMRSLLTRAKTIVESLLRRADASHDAEELDYALIAVRALSHLMRAAKDILRLEEQLGPITLAHVRRVMNDIVSMMRKFIPADRYEDALAFLVQEGLGEAHPEMPALTPDEARSWTPEMIQEYRAGAPLNLVRFMGGPQRARQDSRTTGLHGIVRDAPVTNGGPEVLSVFKRNDRLLNLRPILAQTRAVAEEFASHIEVRSGAEGAAKALRVNEALSELIRAANDIVRIEQRLGPILHADLRRLIDASYITIDKFVPEDKRAEAHAYLRGGLPIRFRINSDDCRDVPE